MENKRQEEFAMSKVCLECGKNETLEGYVMCERCIMFDCAMDMKKLGYNVYYTLEKEGQPT